MHNVAAQPAFFLCKSLPHAAAVNAPPGDNIAFQQITCKRPARLWFSLRTRERKKFMYCSIVEGVEGIR